MHILITLFSKHKNIESTCRIGISIDNERVSVALAKETKAGYVLQDCIVETHNDDPATSLKTVLKQLKAPKCPAIISLPIEDSYFHKIKKPEVPDNERDASALFLLKDRLHQGMEDSLVSVIDYPENCRHDDYVMAFEVSKNHIREIVDHSLKAGLDLQAINVMQLGLGDVLNLGDVMAKGVALLIEHGTGVSLLIYRKNALYMIRNLQDISDLVSCLPAPGNAEQADLLMLEIQRTFDYYDSMMSQPLPSELLLAPSFVDLSPLAQHLDASLAPRVGLLDINDRFQENKNLDHGFQRDALGAIAACLQEQHP